MKMIPINNGATGTVQLV